MKYHRNNVPRAYHKMNPTKYWKALLAPNQAAADNIIAEDAEALWEQYGVRCVKSYDPDSDRYKVKQLVAVSEHTKRISNPTPVGHRINSRA